MPDKEWQPSEDTLDDCKAPLWNAIAYLQDLEEQQILLEIALEQFKGDSEAGILKRVHLLLEFKFERSQTALHDLRSELRKLCMALRPDDLTDLPAGRITPRYWG